MSIFECIENAVSFRDENGDAIMDAERGKQAQQLYLELRDKYMQGMDRSSAEATAGADVKRILRERTAVKRHRVSQQLRANHYLKTTIESHVDWRGNPNPGDGAKRLMERVDFSARAISRMQYRRLNDFINKHSKNILGRNRDAASMDRVTRELLGESTGDAVSSAMARSLRDSFDEMRRMFNAHGGDIAKLENWAPQKWNAGELRKVTPEQFADDMINRLDWDRIINPITEKPFGSANPSRDFLLNAHEGLTGRRLEKLSNDQNRRSLSARHDEHRILHFKSGEDWLQIADKYGNPNLFDAALGYIEIMSRDISLMKHLGPNYEGGFAFLERVVLNDARKKDVEVPGTIAGAESDLRSSRYALGSIDGSGTLPENEFMATAFGGLRNLLSAAQLGGAVLSSVTDYGSSAFAGRYLGMSGSSLVQRQITSLAGVNRQELEQIVGVLDTATDTSAAMVRWIGDFSGPELTRRISSGVFRASGLSRMTDVNRGVFQLEMMGYLFNQKGKALSDLSSGMQEAMKRADISADDWEAVRTSEGTKSVKGGMFLVPDEIRRRSDLTESQRDALSIKFQSLIEQETNIAVPTRDLIADSWAKGLAPPGTLAGEMIRGGLQYKGFPITQMMNQIRRIQAMDGNWTRARYVASMIGAMTALGAVAMTAKDLAKGQTPREPSDPAFWGAAFMQGGGLGIMGDFLFTDYNRYGGSLGTTIAGPQFSFIDRLFRLTIGNADQLLSGDDTDFGEESAKFVKDFMPGGNLWYSRLVMERMVFDQIQKFVDPEAREAFGRREKAAEERSQEYFWEPGDFAPSL